MVLHDIYILITSNAGKMDIFINKIEFAVPDPTYCNQPKVPLETEIPKGTRVREYPSYSA